MFTLRVTCWTVIICSQCFFQHTCDLQLIQQVCIDIHAPPLLLGRTPVRPLYYIVDLPCPPESFQMFYLAQPIRIMDHVMTIGKVDQEGHDPMNDRVGFAE